MVSQPTALITGITGQDGSYLAELLLEKGYEVHGIIRRTSSFNTQRIDHVFDRLHLHHGDVTDALGLMRIVAEVKPYEVYNLAAQSHVAVSFQCPDYTANATAIGVLRLLEAVRVHCPGARFYQASTSEMFGNEPAPQNEETRFAPCSPYACAKLFAHHVIGNYREAYGLHASCGILFNHECVSENEPIVARIDGKICIARAEDIANAPRSGVKWQGQPDNLEIWDGDTWSKVTLVTATRKSTKQEKLLRVCGRGAVHEVTSDHVMLVHDGNKSAGELSLDDRLKIEGLPCPPGDNSDDADPRLAEFLGMMAADGHIGRDGHGIRFTKNDEALRGRIAELWECLFGGFARESTYRGGFESSGPVTRIDLRGAPRGTGISLRASLYDSAAKKVVPSIVLNGGPEMAIAFLKAYNRCDGLKGGRQKTEFKSFTTNSPALAQGLYWLAHSGLQLRVTIHPECRDDKIYYHLNLNSPAVGNKGIHLRRPLDRIKSISEIDCDWVYDFETESGTFSSGVGLGHVHNSPRRGETFVTRKITRAAARIAAGRQGRLVLGDLHASRDWGHARDYVRAMWLMLQQDKPDDYVIATGKMHKVLDVLELAFDYFGLDIDNGHLEVCHPKYERPLEVHALCGDASKAKRVLGWEPIVTFEELIREMVEHDSR